MRTHPRRALALNAFKYGALNDGKGIVYIDWHITASGSLQFYWRETGGPEVVTPTVQGFGSTLINEVVTRQLQGSIMTNWDSVGLSVLIELPATIYRFTGAVKPEGESPLEEDDRGPQVKDMKEKRILIVEDEILVAMEIKSELTRLGWTNIEIATTIDEASRRLASDDSPDSAILDVNLRGTKVYPLIPELEAKGVTLILCTGYEVLEPEYEKYPCMRKPANIAYLSHELTRLLRASAREQN